MPDYGEIHVIYMDTVISLTDFQVSLIVDNIFGCLRRTGLTHRHVF